MIKFSDAVAIAIHSMITLASDEERLHTNKEIATMFNISSEHLAKVLQRLHKAGLVETIRGPKGGFKLTKPASQITLYDIYYEIEGEIRVHPCLFNKPVCALERCIFGDYFTNIRAKIKTFLQKTTLAKIVKNNRRNLELLSRLLSENISSSSRLPKKRKE